jgi:hypothetical protein
VTGVVPAQRCLDLIEVLAEHPEGMPLTALAETLSFPKSATHRILSLLVTRGYAHQEELSGRYRLTLRLTGVGFRFLAGTKLSEIAQPILDRLAAQTGELARMAVVDKNGLTWAGMWCFMQQLPERHGWQPCPRTSLFRWCKHVASRSRTASVRKLSAHRVLSRESWRSRESAAMGSPRRKGSQARLLSLR